MSRKLSVAPKPKSVAPRAGEPVTLEMVAQAAGVSPSTVSRILNGTAAVSGLKKQAVDQAIRQLGFVPNPVARGLAGGRTFSIGVVTQAIDSPFYGAALRGIEDELDTAGYSPLFVSGHWNPSTEARCIEVLRSRRVDGVIVLTGRLPDEALAVLAQSLPVVVTGRELHAPNLYSLHFNNFEGGRLATRHLIELGHRHIAFITGDAEHPDSNERLRGYRVALEECGLQFSPALVIPGQYHEMSGLEAVDRLVASRERFTAIFAANDQMAVGAALGLKRHGLSVPDHISLIGFDDLPSSLYLVPPLSSVHHPAYESGRLAAASMLALLAGVEPTGRISPPQVVARESSRALSV